MQPSRAELCLWTTFCTPPDTPIIKKELIFSPSASAATSSANVCTVTDQSITEALVLFQCVTIYNVYIMRTITSLPNYRLRIWACDTSQVVAE